ncbi:hypothetical protein BT96DRAFT_442325 [Gymnopus androsaceus JB14]|uniref:NB-ARC domain-containing protein n=1 Tax=Gymnopus androsaceus JB14 TaxID=1447944 RepID=A0A6A4GR56_9AGAR|nr:hypothetical protein BT96DRAFT_442325 [Gymnopus androsaceus JB14]
MPITEGGKVDFDPSAQMFSGASNFNIGNHATFNAASTMYITNARESIQASNIPTGYTEGMTHCPTSTQFFTGRGEILQLLERHFLKRNLFQERGRRKIFLLYGLGGGGKTQCALEFIRRFEARFAKVYFISAHSEDSIKASYYDVAASSGTIAVPSWEYGRKWLATHKDEWLVIFDNADDPRMNLGQMLPSCEHGNIIITSRNSWFSQYCKPIRGIAEHASQ